MKRDFERGRHLEGVNVCFADGHVKWYRSQVVLSEADKFNRDTHPESAWDPRAQNN